MASSDSGSGDSLSSELAKWKKAYEEEFELTKDAESDEDFAALRLKLKRRVYEHAFDAIDNIAALSKAADSDSTKAVCSKWLADKALTDAVMSATDDDPMNAFLAELTKSTKKAKKPS